MPRVSVFDIVPWRPPVAAAAVVTIKSERIACRTRALTDLARETDIGQRDAIRRLWVLSKCKTCGECADMSER